MKKEEIIKRYGEAEYKKQLEQGKEWQEANPKMVVTLRHEHNRKGGSGYEQKLEYNNTGLQGERHRIRTKHANKWQPFKKIIAPDSQIHHEWVPETAEYRGVALVEKDQHQRGIVDVIRILDGNITLLSEEEVKEYIARM